MRQYVLGKPDRGTGVIRFVWGGDPEHPLFCRGVDQADKFDSVEAALQWRSRMGWILGGTEQCRVHELRPDGTVVDAEA